MIWFTIHTHTFSPTFLLLQGWVYNVIPWLTAIPSALCGGYVSDFLISQGILQISQFILKQII